MARSSRTTRLARYVTLIGLVAGLITIVGQAPASADSPTITISPTSITSGDTVTIDLAGFSGAASDLVRVDLCPSTVDLSEGYAALEDCASLSLFAGTSAHITRSVSDTNSAPNGGFTCSALPAGCIVVGSDVDVSTPFTIVDHVSTPIAIAPAAQTISASPSSGRSGDTVTVATTGFPAGQPGAIGLCPANVTADTIASCGAVTEYPTGVPASAEVQLRAQVQATGGDWFRCDNATCAIAAWTTETPSTFAQTPVDVTPVGVEACLPVLGCLPGFPLTNVHDGDTVVVTVTNATPGPATVRECPPDDDIDGTYPPATCTAPQPFTVGDDGSASPTVVFHNPFTDVSGQSHACTTACDLVVVTSDGPLQYGATVSVAPPPSPPSIQAALIGPYPDGATTLVLLQDFGGSTAQVAECEKSSIGTDLASSDCAEPVTTPLDAGTAFLSAFPLRATFPGSSGTVDCRTVDCVVAAFGEGGQVAVDPTPIEFVAPLDLTLTPSTGVHDGDPISVAASGLNPNSTYRVARCLQGAGAVAGRCERPLPALLASDSSGSLNATTTAAQRFTTGGLFNAKVCHDDDCSIAIIDSYNQVVIEKPYTLATPTVTATPATGLADGDTVTIAGTDLEPTYAGPTVIFPSGGWAAAQCDAAVGTHPSIVEVFTNCAIPAGGATIDVPGTTSSTPVTVAATINHLLGGGTTDCTTGPGACVTGLVRWEQDGSTTAAFTPLTFG